MRLVSKPDSVKKGWVYVRLLDLTGSRSLIVRIKPHSWKPSSDVGSVNFPTALYQKSEWIVKEL